MVCHLPVQDVATMIRYGQNPIIFLINNGGCASSGPLCVLSLPGGLLQLHCILVTMSESCYFKDADLAFCLLFAVNKCMG